MSLRRRTRIGLAAAAAVAGLTTAVVPATAAGTAETSGTAAAAPANCPKLYFCGYPKANYQGTAWKITKCNVYYEIPDGWNSGGSWYNNQSKGTVARMYDKNKKLIYSTPPAASGDPTGNWGPVWYVKAC
ncbi:peptidase inhibitor family I36 protein [Streptomyces sp. HU2014]|uniref:Peptidase inhibitor family I36 n=1 Tax=Streptomyces albireticuli TaxID=1940 RepID=A0A1Z2LBM2_9ACTN|nr:MULTISPECIES: peptidase inhibitor family I36 protein [Streptomyces]ARZ71682.1 hypothetical protein SMD11_6106 [Streptomyces albireticuli]UQI45130.1 peptidase inhibitor family I36 protein [Streptomyces sp. HU2014]